MRKFRVLILAIIFIFGAFVAYGLFSTPKAEALDSDTFSAERVIKDIRIISQKHHSIAQPDNLAEVRGYLTDRLEEMGADVRLYEYKSLEARGYQFDATNIIADFAPAKPLADTTWLMMVAHYDSRPAQKFQQDTVWSYGAADDGYGLGVILETVSQALKSQDSWNQGIRVVFTDAEEVGMEGMKQLWGKDKEVFDNVGLVINVEGRGPWGPCLLFETAPGNEKLMDLYADTCKYPYTYSLTTVVYQFMPNYTDFTIIKDEMPGFNFSTVADINRYHTHLDNFGNIDAKTIQHYGAQILPITMKYLCSAEYSDPEYFKSDKDTVNFSIPLLGLFNFTKTQYLIINIIIFVLFLLVMGFDILRGNVKFGRIAKIAAFTLLIGVAVLGIGELIAYICANIAGVPFKLFGIVQGVMFDNTIMIIASALLAIICLICYLCGRSKSKRLASVSMRSSSMDRALYTYSHSRLYGVLFLSLVMSLGLVIALNENLMFLIPLGFATLALLLWHITGLKLFIPLALACIMLHAYSFLYALAMALTIGAFGAVAMLAFFDLMVIIPLADLYLTERRKR